MTNEVYGVFVEWRDHSVRCVAVAPDHGLAQRLHAELTQYLACRKRFKACVEDAQDTEVKRMLIYFEKMEKGKRESEIVRSGVNSVPFFK